MLMRLITSLLYLCSFFFSSRRRHTRLQGDWSSDVCSSDLKNSTCRNRRHHAGRKPRSRLRRHCRDIAQESTRDQNIVRYGLARGALRQVLFLRSEERRVGKEGRSWWSAYH